MNTGNIGLRRPMIPLTRSSEATPMPRPIPLPTRLEVVRRHQQGTPLTRIAAELAISYGAAREIWGRYRLGGLERLAPDYRAAGRPVPPSTRELTRIACELKRDHPTWGAGRIRLELRAPARGARIPSARSLQLAFVR